MTDLAKRIQSGEIYDANSGEIPDFEVLLKRAAKLYPSIRDYHPVPGREPSLGDVTQEIEGGPPPTQQPASAPGPTDEDDVPF